MFTYVRAKNFKSLKNIEFNLNKTNENTNNFIAIYGENGSGKTNIVELFKFFQQITVSRTVDGVLTKLPKDFFEEYQKMLADVPNEINAISEFSLNLKEYRTLDEDENTELEYHFKINGIKGIYCIKFNTEIVEESLYYLVKKQNGFYFNIKKEEKEIKSTLNKNVFINEKYREELVDNINKYWGKYSFLSLVVFELMEKNREYVFNNINSRMFDIIDRLFTMTIHVNKWALKMIPDNYIKDKKIMNLKSGKTSKDNLNTIKKYENVLNVFFTQAYADIKGVEYKIEEQKDEILYKLYFKKLIGGKLKFVSVELESEGTKRIIEEFDTLIGAIMGETVVIDEIDNGIHDLLIKNIIMSIKDEINGQLIITTHNTLLLEVLPKECIYVLTTDYEGNKYINSIRDFGTKIQKNHNIRDLYFKGLFGGIPTTDYVDFEEIKYALEDSTKDKEKNNANKT